MRRIAFVACAVVLGAVGVSCIPAAPPPPAYQPPVVAGISQSPDPAVPGEPVTVSVEVVDDQAVSDVALQRVIVPSGAVFPGPMPCDDEIVQSGEVGRATVELTCDVPSFASNGTWKVEVRIYDRPEQEPGGYGYVGMQTVIPFVVAGGTDDASAPWVLDWSVEPEDVRGDAPFTLTMRLRDDAPLVVPPSSFGLRNFTKFGSNWSMYGCSEPTFTPVTATESIATTQCGPLYNFNPGIAEPGWYVAYWPVGDALGHLGKFEMWLEVH